MSWWRTGVIYQAYIRSFSDSDGDGVGDLAGLERRLDYLKWLGVDAVWITPFQPSPMADFGYDVADYCGVDPLFGDLAAFDRLLASAHGRGLRVVIDMVPNHTSDRHPWFLESRAGRQSSRRDWYVWRDPAPDGGPPNNWLSVFGGPAWEWDEASGQYFLHSYLAEQPDLNWRNPEVERAVFDAMRFWLDRGVDGFRMDVLWMLTKDEAFRDNPPNRNWRPGMMPYLRLDPVHSTDRPETLEIVRRMRALMDGYPGERLLIGEVYLPVSRLVAYYGDCGDGAQLPFNFKLIQANWEAGEIDALVRRYEAAVPDGCWPNWVLGNHDNPRTASRIGEAAARSAAVLLLTLRGTPTLYYGEELGLPDVEVPPDRVQDPWERRNPGHGRDGCRWPMPWSGQAHAGFSTAEPWLPLPPDWPTRNAEAQAADAGSTLSLYRRLLGLRRAEAALHSGTFQPLGVQGQVMAYAREADGTRFHIAVNFGDTPGRFDGLHGDVLLETGGARLEAGGLALGPHGAAILRS